MRISTVILLALMLIPTAVAGRAPVPGKPDKLPWRLLFEDEKAALFVAVTGRSGDRANLASMIVLETPVEDGGPRYDGLAETIAVHCPTKRYRREYYRTARDGMELPPPVVIAPLAPDPVSGAETAFMLEPPAVGSMRHDQFAIACGEAALPATRVTNPYRWARQRFGLKTPAAKSSR